MPEAATSIHAIAHELGIAASTVSRALNGHPAISAKTRARVLEASRRLNFRPRSQLPCVAVVMATGALGMKHNYCTAMLSLLANALTAQGMPLELLDFSDIDRARKLHIAAVISVGANDALLRLRDVPNLPLFTIHCPLREHGIHSAVVDHEQGARIGTEHLLEHGHRRIAFLEWTAHAWGSVERQNGFRKAMAAAGVEVRDDAFYFLSRDGQLYDILRRIKDGGFTAFLNLDETATMEAPHILSKVMGLTLPRDLSMVCIESHNAHAYLAPPQTIIHQPLDEVVIAVAKAIKEMVEHGAPAEPLDIRVDSTLIVRESVASIAN